MVDGKTQVLGVIGDPIEHTFSPAMHNAGLDALNLNYIYLPFHVKEDKLGECIQGAKAMGIKGLNVTIPHKTNVIKHLDDIDSVASMIGAVNTIQFNFDENNFDNYEINVPGESFKMKDNINVKVFSETDLDNQIRGPAIIKFDYTSVLVPAGFESSILDNGILSIKKSVKEE